jgi:hypothetical protein
MDLSRKRIGIRITDLIWPRRHVHVNHFISGGKHGDSRTRVSEQARSPNRRRDGDCRVVHARSRRQHLLALSGLGSGKDDILVARNSPLHLNSIFRPRGVFQHYDGIGALRNRSASHDRDGLPGLKWWDFRGGVSGLDLPDHLECCRRLLEVDETNRVSVSGCSMKWRVVAIGVDRLGQHSTGRIEQAQQLTPAWLQPRRMLLDKTASVFKAENV